MDAAGFCAIADVLDALALSREALDAIVRTNNKARFEVRGERIRASQGHSREGMPVTLDALEASWSRFAGDGPVWHGTRRETLPLIRKDGLLPGARTHVHLAPAKDARVGKRAHVEVLLEVAPARLADRGIAIFESPNGVLLARTVPPDCIVAEHAP